MNETKEYYPAEEVADRLGLHVRTVRRFIREGKLKARRVGKQYRVTAGELDAFAGASERTGSIAPANRRRRVLVATTVDIDAISKDEQSRLVTPLTSVFQSSADQHGSTRIDAIYYEEQGRLRIVIHGDLGLTNAVLGMIGAILDDGRATE